MLSLMRLERRVSIVVIYFVSCISHHHPSQNLVLYELICVWRFENIAMMKRASSSTFVSRQCFFFSTAAATLTPRRKMLLHQLRQKGRRNSPNAEADVLTTLSLLDAGGAPR